MSQLNFPPNPTIGQTHTIGTNTWIWNGSAWIKVVPPRNIANVFTVTEILYVTSTTNSFSTLTGALIVTGGVGIGRNLYIGENLNVAGISTFTNLTDSIDITTGAVQVLGGMAVAKNLSVGQSLTVNNSITSSIANITSSTGATSAGTGALLVTGGISAGNGLFVTGQATIETSSPLTYPSGTPSLFLKNAGSNTAIFQLRNSTDQAVNFWNSAGELILSSNSRTLLSSNGDIITFPGRINVTSATNSVSTSSGAIIVAGGIGVGKDITIGGIATIGQTTSSVVIDSIKSNNYIISSYTSPTISTTSTQNLDAFNTSSYRTARYVVQVTDDPSVHVSEISVFHANGIVYLNEYGVNYNHYELGVFDANIVSNNLTLQFTPTTATSMVIKVLRLGIAI